MTSNKAWPPEIGQRVYVNDPSRYPTGHVVELRRHGRGWTVTIDTGSHEGLMPRYLDFPLTALRPTCRLTRRKASA